VIESKAAVEAICLAELHLELRPAIHVRPLKTMSKATTVMNVQVALE
jgi:hypothetical protein